MSRLTVGSLEGLSENSNVISVPAGHTLNAVDGLQIGGVTQGAWITWTPSYSAGAGSGTVSTNYARYTKAGTHVTCLMHFTVTNANTASGFLGFTLPFSQSNALGAGAGREVALSNKVVGCESLAGNSVGIQFYDGVTCWVTNSQIKLLYVYESTT